MKVKALFFLVAAMVTAGIARPAAAGIHIEPYVAYGVGSYDVSTLSEDIKGMAYGARLGYSIPMFSFGVEYMGGSFKDEADDVSTIKPTNIGLYASVEFPIMVRAFATYFVSAKANTANDAGESDWKGKGMKLGVGFTFLPFVSLNVEMLTNTYDEQDGESAPDELTIKATMVSVSLPLDL